MYFRTRIEQWDSNYSTSTYTDKGFYFFHQFSFPVGKSLIIEPPTCSGGNTTIKVPYEGNTNYTLTITGPNSNSYGVNVETNAPSVTKENGYYVFSGNFSPGTHTLNVEYKSSECPTCVCPFTTTFTVPEIPPFHLSDRSYPDEIDSYQIRKNGGTGKVSFNVAGSRTPDITIHAENQTFSKTLASTSVTNGTTYYNGSVSIDLTDGNYFIYATNSSCNSDTLTNINLTQPDAISFTATPTSPACAAGENTANGKIDLSDIAGGIGNYKYTLTGGTPVAISNSNATISGLSTGTYTVTVSDNYGNSTSKEVKITAPTPVTITYTSTPPSLSCASDGRATIYASGGKPPYQYSKENTSTVFANGNTVSGYSTGNHSVYVKDANGCVFAFTVKIETTSQLAVGSTTLTAPTCPGGNDGKCVFVMTNRKGTLSVSGLPTSCSKTVSGNTITISGLETGNYSCEITDTYNGTSCSIPATFNIPIKLSIDLETSVTPVSDKGSATGTITVKPSGGNGAPFTIKLFDGNTQIGEQSVTESCVFTGLTGTSGAGKLYRLTVTDSKNCPTQAEARVPEPDEPLSLQATVAQPVSCYGASDAQISLSAQGGWGDYLYSRDNLLWQSQPNFSGFAAGNYTFYVKDIHGGSQSANITVSQPQPLTIVRDSLLPVLCHGEATGWIRFRVSGGTYPYTLLPETGSAHETITGGDTLITVSGLPAGNYTFSVKDAHNCTTIATSETIVEPAQLALSAPVVTHTTCEADNGVVNIVASGGVAPYSYRLQAEDRPDFQPQTQTLENADTASFSDLPPATYRITVTDRNGCITQSQLFVIAGYTNPAIDSVAVRAVACFGENNGRIEVFPRAGTRPVETFTLTSIDGAYTESNTSGVFENLYAGEYRINVYDTNGCSSYSSYPVTIHEPDVLSIEIEQLIPSAGKGKKEGKIFFRIQGGNAGSKTVRLRDSNDEVCDSLSVVNDAPFVFTVSAGSYSLEVTDAKYCRFVSGQLQVEEPANSLRFIIKEAKDALCKSQTGRIVVEGVGGWGEYRYKRESDTYFSSLNRFENLYPGNYRITVTDRMGAVYSETISINEPQDSLKAEVVAIVPPTCGNDGQIALSLSGGTPPYKLYSAAGDTLFCAAPQIQEWTGLTGGSLLLHLSDANGCRFDIETFLPDTALLKIEGWNAVHPSAPGAADGSLHARIHGGTPPYDYQWTSVYHETNVLTGSNADRMDNLSAGYYSLKVTGAGGCTVEDHIYLADPADFRLEIIEIKHETAFEAADGSTVLYSPEIHPVECTLYSVPPSSLSPSSVIRNDTVFLQNLASGRWFISARSASGEQAVAEWEINPCPAFVFADTLLIPASRPGASDGEIRVTVKGGGGENRFTWTIHTGETLSSADDEQQSALSGIPAGVYTVEVEDRYGNRLSRTFKVPEPDEALRIGVAQQENQNCHTFEDAYVVLEAAGGWGDYQFNHRDTSGHETGFSNAAAYAGLSTGVHRFYLTDRRGVVDSLEATITEPEYLRAAVAFIDSVKCKGAADGAIEFDITGGTPPYFFLEQGVGFWNEGHEALRLKAGEHTFVFTDSRGCEGQDTLTVYVPEPDSLLFRNIAVTHTLCNEDNGQIAVAMQGGTHPYFYRWLDFDGQLAGTDSIITGLKQNGLYRLTVTDNNGCTASLEQLINPSTRPQVLGVETGDVLCYGDTTGWARITGVVPATPYASYTLTWSNGDGGELSDRFAKGQHWLTVEDENGCSSTFYFDIGQPDSLQIRIAGVREPHCFGYSDAYIHTETRGGWGEYTYLWSTGDTTPNLDAIPQGDYWVQVTDANGCTDRQQITLKEPPYLTVDLGEDVLMCPGNTHTVDGGDYVSCRWFTESEGDLSSDRYLFVTREDHYFLEAKNERGCSVWGDIQVSIGNSALTAGLLLASEAALGDTLVVFELSNMELDSLIWEYDATVFERIENSDSYDLPYILQLKCLKTGVYTVGLTAYSGGCYSPASKQVEVVEVREKPGDPWMEVAPLIISLTEYPNPTSGLFTVELELREAAPARLILFEVASGICVDQRNVEGAETYRIEYNLPQLNSGIYVLLVTAGNERRQVKIIFAHSSFKSFADTFII